MSLLERKEAPLSPWVRVNPIVTCSHNSLHFPFLNTHYIVLPCEACDSRDHIISSLPIPRAWHRAWHLGGAQILAASIEFQSLVQLTHLKDKNQGTVVWKRAFQQAQVSGKARLDSKTDSSVPWGPAERSPGLCPCLPEQ